VPLVRLPRELHGLRIAHLSDLHLGVPSRGAHAVRGAFAWVAERRPDLVAITGDLLTRPAGEPLLRELLATLPAPAFAVLGNHDFAISRDPFARPSQPVDLSPARELGDTSAAVEVRGHRVQVAGVDPRTYRGRRAQPEPDPQADLRILLCHFPAIVDRLPAGAFDLVLAGHMHDGQIALPYPGGKLRFAHLQARYERGLYATGAGRLHVSPGLGTTFVPFRFAARPEATELVLQSPPWAHESPA
jgi:predicted MPP superfamily phosphohydrolase